MGNVLIEELAAHSEVEGGADDHVHLVHRLGGEAGAVTAAGRGQLVIGSIEVIGHQSAASRRRAQRPDRTGQRRGVRTVIDAVGSLEVEALLTTGWGLDHDEFGSLPANVVVEEYAPQAQVLRLADLVVCHGGSGTMLASLAAGLPVVSLPHGADQFINAPWWSQSGAVTVVQPPDVTPMSLASCISPTVTGTATRGRLPEASAQPATNEGTKAQVIDLGLRSLRSVLPGSAVVR